MPRLTTLKFDPRIDMIVRGPTKEISLIDVRRWDDLNLEAVGEIVNEAIRQVLEAENKSDHAP